MGAGSGADHDECYRCRRCLCRCDHPSPSSTILPRIDRILDLRADAGPPHRAVLHGDDAFVGGKGPDAGAPEYWPRTYIYDGARGGWQTGLVSADAARPRHFPCAASIPCQHRTSVSGVVLCRYPLLARALLQRHMAASLRCDAGHKIACRAPGESFGQHHDAQAEEEKRRRRGAFGRSRYRRKAGLSRLAEVEEL